MSHSEPLPPTENHPSTDRTGRTQRACTQDMTIQALLDGRYQVIAQSGQTYFVTPDTNTCSCPDPASKCKHLRRVKLDIAFGELPHPVDCPTDAELAAREPARAPSTPTLPSTPTSIPAPATAVADGGQTVEQSSPPETDTASVAICRAISNRIRDLEREIDCYRAELHDLQTALSVIEDITEQPHTSEEATAVAALPHVHANR
jgi:hypothetical protein